MKDNRPELGVLQELITLNQCKNCVELGVAKGVGTVSLCRGASKVGGKVLGFDVWSRHGANLQFGKFGSKEAVEEKLKKEKLNNFKLFKINTITQSKEVGKIIDKEFPEGIDFAFIDGDHSYLGVKNDFKIVYPRLSKYGIIALHDTYRIDGCREFVFYLRTTFNDGTFDIVDFPFGHGPNRNGFSLLVKRMFPVCDLSINEICGSTSKPHEIEQMEANWYDKEVKQQPKPNYDLFDSKIDKNVVTKRCDRKKFERIPE